MKPLQSAVFLFVGLLFFTACKKENGSGSGTGPGPGPGSGTTPTVYTPSPVTASVSGLIVNENDMPVAGVTVRSGVNTTTTNSKGYFNFSSIQLDQNASEISAELIGYFKAYRVFQARDNGNHFVKIKLIPETQAGSMSASSGGQVTLPDASVINVPATSLVVKGSNQAYSGTVKVLASSIDPTAADIDERIPGSFEALNKNNQIVDLRSFGMMAVELQGQNGESLQLASGKTAKLRFSIPSTLSGQAPATIPLWYVDEATGLWKEEGVATRSGNFYDGDIKHFSFWNADMPDTSIFVKMTLHAANSSPVIGAEVRMERLDANNGAAYGFTDTAGYVGGRVSVNKELKLRVLNNCNEEVYEKKVGPFLHDTDLGVLVVYPPVSYSVNFSGTAVCGGQPVTNGYVEVYFEYRIYRTPVQNGQFSLTLSRCPGSSDALLYVVDNDHHQISSLNTYPTSSGQVNTGTIQACAKPTDNYLNYTLDGINYEIGKQLYDTTLSIFTGNEVDIGAYGHNGRSVVFNFLASGTGTYPVHTLFIDTSLVDPIQPFNVSLTSFAGAVGEFMEGSFGGTYHLGSGTHTILGYFRMRRNF